MKNHIQNECQRALISCTLCHVSDLRTEYINHDTMHCIRNLNKIVNENEETIEKLKQAKIEEEIKDDDKNCPYGHQLEEQHNVSEFPCNFCRKL